MPPKPASVVTLPGSVPLFPLPALMLPRSNLSLNIFEPRYLAMTDHALAHGRFVGMVQPREDKGHEAPTPPLYDVGCAGIIQKFEAKDDGRYTVQLGGLSRYRIVSERLVDGGFRVARADWAEFTGDLVRAPAEVDRKALLAALDRLLTKKLKGVSLERVDDEQLVALGSGLCPLRISERQALLEARDLSERASVLLSLLAMNEAGSPARGGGSLN